MTSSNKLHLNRRNAVISGVCAGIADYFNIDRFIIRIIAVIAAITWWPTVIVYIVLAFCLSDNKPSLSEMGENLGNSRVGRHFKNVDYSKRIYKSRRNRKIAGVCAGLADYMEVSPFVVRIFALLSLFFGPFAVIAYIIAAIIMDVNPDEAESYPSRRQSRRERRRQRRQQRRYGYDREEFDVEPEPRSYQSKSQSRQYTEAFDKRDLHECTEKFSNLERKLQRLEATITSKKFKLNSEFKRMAT